MKFDEPRRFTTTLIPSDIMSSTWVRDTVKVMWRRTGRQDRRQYRWVRKSANHKIVGAATERYFNLAECLANMVRNNQDLYSGGLLREVDCVRES